MFPPQPPPAVPQSPPPPPPAPPGQPKSDDTPIPMDPEDLRQWWSRVERSRAMRQTREKRWEALLNGYLPSENVAAINSNIHFRNTEQKKASLFPSGVKVRLEPAGPLEDQRPGPDGQMHTAEDVTTIKEAVLTKQLGPTGIDLKWLIDECAIEMLQVSGWGPTEILYEADLVDVQQPVQTGDTTMPGAVLGLQTVPQMEMQSVPVPIFEEWTWKKFSSKKLLIPDDWRSCRFDEATWIGREGTMPLSQALNQKLVPPDFTPNATRDEHVFTPSGGQKVDGGTDELVEYVKIWYRPSCFAKTGVTHRQVVRRLVLVKGLEQPAKHTKSPYQSLDPNTGKMTPDSMIGYPIHVFTLRDLPDSAFIPSDAAMTDPLVRQENTWASQDIAMRDSNIPRFLWDERLAEAMKKLQAGNVGDGASVESALLMSGIEKLIAQLPHLEKAESDIRGRAALRQAINETLAIGPNQSGAVNTKVLSATEISTAEKSSNERGAGEKSRLKTQVCVGIRKLDALIQRFASEAQYVQWVGTDGAKRMTAWDQHLVAGEWAYDLDLEADLDPAQDRQQWIQYVNLMGSAPEAVRPYLLREMSRKFGADPTKAIQAPPPKGPDQLKIALSIDTKSLSPLAPESPIVMDLLQKNSGIQIDPQAITSAMGLAQQLLQQQAQTAMLTQAHRTNAQALPGQTEHPGALTEAGTGQGLEPISKHAGDLTGRMVGRGPM